MTQYRCIEIEGEGAPVVKEESKAEVEEAAEETAAENAVAKAKEEIAEDVADDDSKPVVADAAPESNSAESNAVEVESNNDATSDV